MFDVEDMGVQNQWEENHKLVRAKMREIISARDAAKHLRYSANGTCRACNWKCSRIDRTCVVDGDVVKFYRENGEEAEEWEHWCVIHNPRIDRRNYGRP